MEQAGIKGRSTESFYCKRRKSGASSTEQRVEQEVRVGCPGGYSRFLPGATGDKQAGLGTPGTVHASSSG